MSTLGEVADWRRSGISGLKLEQLTVDPAHRAVEGEARVADDDLASGPRDSRHLGNGSALVRDFREPAVVEDRIEDAVDEGQLCSVAEEEPRFVALSA